MEYDVVVVGGGPSGLATAIKFAQLNKENGTDYSICLLEKGSEIGAHILSGNVFQPNALDELIKNPDSRRACMVYNRPSIWLEYKENGKNDFICTNAVTYYIRDGYLDCVIQMRSNDVVYGYKNDYAWQQYILSNLADDLDLEPGNMIWQVQNLHVYEKHFDLIKPKKYA